MRYNVKLRLGLFLTVFGLLIGVYAYRLIQLQVVNPRRSGSGSGTYTYDTRVIISFVRLAAMNSPCMRPASASSE